MLVEESISPDVDNTGKGDLDLLASGWDARKTVGWISFSYPNERWKSRFHSQPVNHHIMREAENELVDDPVNAHCPTHKLQCSVLRVVEDEMIPIEVS